MLQAPLSSGNVNTFLHQVELCLGAAVSFDDVVKVDILLEAFVQALVQG